MPRRIVVQVAVPVWQASPARARVTATQPGELRDPARFDPFGDDDVAVVVEAGVVRVDEFAGLPGVGLRAELLLVDLLLPVGIVGQVGERLVVLVEERDARAEVGHEHRVAVQVEVARQQEAFDGAQVLALGREVFQDVADAVGDDDGRLAAGAVVVPEAVRVDERRVAVAGAAEAALPVGVFVVAVDPEAAVAVGQRGSRRRGGRRSWWA